jgi:hypothetical protein
MEHAQIDLSKPGTCFSYFVHNSLSYLFCSDSDIAAEPEGMDLLVSFF